MRRVGWWLVGAAVVSWAAIVVVAQFGGHGLPWWLGVLPWVVFAVLVAARAARELAKPTSRRPLRSVLRPGAQGLDEVQGMQLGRPPGLVVTYGDEEPAEVELVVPHADDLDSGPWTIARRPDGSVVVDTSAPDDSAPGAATATHPHHPHPPRLP